jgi:hypothetical protein
MKKIRNLNLDISDVQFIYNMKNGVFWDVIIIIIIFISINPVQSRMWKSQYKYKISSTEYNVSIVIEASKYIKQVI